MLALPQAPIETFHHFGPGTYSRQMNAPAETLIMGMEHRGPCLNLLVLGSCVLIDVDGTTRRVDAPHIFVSPPGRKLAYTLTPMTWLNVWATDETDIPTLERTLFVEPDTFAEDMASLGFTVDQVREISENGADVALDSALTPLVEVRNSAIQGFGVFPFGEPIEAGHHVGTARLNGLRTNLGRFVNHSRTPNIEYQNWHGDIQAYALRDIALGEEITVDYRQARGVA